MNGARTAPSRAVPWIVGALLVVTATFFVLNALDAEHPWINHDVGYHTYLGQEMARGSRLYVDLKEDNPPGSPILLGMIAVVADTLGIPDFVAQHLFVLGVGLAGLLVLRFALGKRDEEWVWPLTALAYLLVVLRGGFSNSILADDPGVAYDFGQREHLFSLLFLPYLLTRLERGRSPWWLLPFVALLGWVATFKPFWPPMIVLVEVFVLWRKGWTGWRVPAALFGGMLFPFAALGLHSFDSLARFVTENVPMYFRGGYDFYENSYGEFLRTPLSLQLILGVAACLLAAGFAVKLKALPPPSAGLVLALCGVAYFGLWHQGKFWSYHAMPVFALTVVGSAFLAALALGRLRRPAVGRPVAAVLAVVLLAWSGSTLAGTARLLTRYPPLGSFLVPIVEPYERVMYFSMSVMVQYPPLHLRREMVGPWTVFLDLPELLALPDEAERERRLAEFAADVGATIERERPELLVFSPQTQALPTGTSLRGVLLDLEALPLADYRAVSARQLGATDDWSDEWFFYLRADLAGGARR